MTTRVSCLSRKLIYFPHSIDVGIFKRLQLFFYECFFIAQTVFLIFPSAEVKRDIRAVLLQRPFDLDLIQLQAIPLFENLPEVIAKDIWIEAFLVQFEAGFHWCRDFYPTYGRDFTWNKLSCLMDGCRDKNLLKRLKEQEEILIVNELVLEWLLDNLHIDQ